MIIEKPTFREQKFMLTSDEVPFLYPEQLEMFTPERLRIKPAVSFTFQQFWKHSVSMMETVSSPSTWGTDKASVRKLTLKNGVFTVTKHEGLPTGVCKIGDGTNDLANI